MANASSDMLIVNFSDTRRITEGGDLLAFKLKYLGALSILNSDYIDKKVE